MIKTSSFILSLLLSVTLVSVATALEDDVVRVFIFAGQSNMVGSDSKAQDIKNFPPFTGLESPQPAVRFSYCLGRENKTVSDGWAELAPVNNLVGPELSFAREVTRTTDAPIAIIKVAAGGTHLGGDWNPDKPIGFQMYPLALEHVRKSLAQLDEQNIPYRIEGVMWHQGENDMFDKDYMANYGSNLKNYLACWRRDLELPKLKFYIGELCTKTIWGMDLRPRMHAISVGQKDVTNNDPNADYVPTSHVGVEIGGGVGLHYHYGTLGQLEHGVNYAHAYLKSIGKLKTQERPLKAWPYQPKSSIKLFVLAGHRNMEGERAFVQDLQNLEQKSKLIEDDFSVAFKYNIGGGYKTSIDWEPLGPAGFYETFGPELSFAKALRDDGIQDFAIAKFTHSGSQIIDWTPAGSVATTRNLYPSFVNFIKESIEELEAKGHDVDLAGIFYHVGENDMSWGPFRKSAPQRVISLIQQSRKDLNDAKLNWFVCQQSPTDDKAVNEIQVTERLAELLAGDSNTEHIQAFDPPKQEKQLIFDAQGIVWLGEQIAKRYLEKERSR